MLIAEGVCLNENERNGPGDFYNLVIDGQKALVMYSFSGSLVIETYEPYSRRVYSRQGLPKKLEALREVLEDSPMYWGF